MPEAPAEDLTTHPAEEVAAGENAAEEPPPEHAPTAVELATQHADNVQDIIRQSLQQSKTPPATSRRISLTDKMGDKYRMGIPGVPQSPMAALEQARKAATELSGAIGEALGDAPQTSNEKGDEGWDSVAAQFSCQICDMVFPSAKKLENHVIYSEHHKKNVARRASIRANEVMSPTGKKLAASFADGEVTNENDHLIYQGTKHFWDSKEVVELSMFENTELARVTVIAVNKKTEQRYPPLFLDRGVILAQIDIKTLSNIDHLTDDKTKMSTAADVEALHLANERNLISSFVLVRLKLREVDGGSERELYDQCLKAKEAHDEHQAEQVVKQAELVKIIESNKEGGNKKHLEAKLMDSIYTEQAHHGTPTSFFRNICIVALSSDGIGSDDILLKPSEDGANMLFNLPEEETKRRTTYAEMSLALHDLEKSKIELQRSSQTAKNLSNASQLAMDAFSSILDGDRRHTFAGKNTKWNLAAQKAVQRKKVETAENN